MSSRISKFDAPLSVSSPGLDRTLLNLGVTEDSLQRAKSNSSKSKIICSLNALEVVNQSELLQQISSILSLELVSLEQLLNVEPKVLTLITAKRALELRCFPLKCTNEGVVFALADPLDHEAISELSFNCGGGIKIALASEEDILQAIFLKLLSSKNQSDDADVLEVITRVAESSAKLPTLKFDDVIEPFSTDEGKETIKIVNKIFYESVKKNASDVHIEPSLKSLEVRFRLNGVLCHNVTLSKEQQNYVISRIKVLAEMDTTDTRHPQDGRFRLKKHGVVLRDVRVSSVPTVYGEKLLLRLLNTEEQQITFDWIGMPLDLENKIKAQLSLVDKLMLVSGPTGAGKSTTLYACVCDLKEKGGNIITVEDPIEYRVEGITQIEVNEKSQFGFADGLRSVLRQDPDVIMVGEIRDAETASIAVQAAQTGHLVLSSLHTNDAASAIIRLVDLGIERYLIAASVGAVLAQRLVRKLCDNCATPLQSDKTIDEAKVLELNINRMREAVGCELCHNSGYNDRIGIFSLLVVTAKVREAIRSGLSELEIASIAQAEGMKSLVEQARTLIEEGITTIDEVKRILGVIEKQSVSATELVCETAVSNTIPKVFQEQQEVGLSESLSHLVAQCQSSQNERPVVMIVDDEEGLLLILGKKLGIEKYDVVSARNGKEALAKLEQVTPDLIVVDLMLPEINGHQLVEKIRARESTAKTPIMMLTNIGDDDQELKALSGGVNDYVNKTTSVKVVVARIRKLLEQSGFKFTNQ
jgi:type IV pilus assembly protein PilB